MKKKLFFKYFILAVILISLSACQTLGSPVQEPVIEFHTVDFVGISFTDMELLFQIRVNNPNPFEIPFPEIAWELFLNENSFIRGDIRSRGNIRAQNSVIVEIPVNINFLDIFTAFASLRGRNDVDYRIAIGVRIPLPVLRNRVWNLEHRGQIPLPQMPRLSSPSMRVENVDLQGAQVLVSVNVVNPNLFNLPPPNLSMDFQINNSSFFNSTLDVDNIIAAESATPVAFRFSVRFADIFLRFITLRNQREVSTLLNLSLDFGVPAFMGDAINIQIPGTLPLR